MPSIGRLLLRRSLPWLIIGSALLACRLPQPPLSTAESPLLSPLTADSPVATPAKGEGSPVWIPFVGRTPSSGSGTRSAWTLVGLAGAAGLLFVATAAVVFLLIRGLPRTRLSKRSRVPDASPGVPESAPLAAGTMLNEGRYLVLSVQGDAGGPPVYEVKPTLPLDLCPHCFHVVTQTADQACTTCGRPLPLHRPEHPVLLAWEVVDPDHFVLLLDLVKKPVDHPAVVAPVNAYKETAFGADRQFVVVPDVGKRLQDRLHEPVPLELALGWGSMLAKGLEALHTRGIVLTAIGAGQVQVDEGDARWLCFDQMARVADPKGDEARERVASNVRDLAALVILAAAGAPAVESGPTAAGPSSVVRDALAQLPDPPRRVLSQVLKAKGRLHAGDLSVALARAREAILRDRPVRYLIGTHTDVGRIRKLNEDSLFALDLSSSDTGPGSSVSVVAVADGVGGHAAGDVASQLTVAALSREVDALKTELAAGQPLDAKGWIASAAIAANAAVLSERQAMESDMGSTLVMALLTGVRATLLNVGDSRAYHLRPSGIRQVTKDHSLVQRLVDIGQLTPEDARHHPQKSVIYRVMGDTPQLGYDLFETDLEPGDALLLCSDGLSDLVEDRVLWQVWRETPKLQDACKHLVRLANEGGGHDNITVVILQIAS